MKKLLIFLFLLIPFTGLKAQMYDPVKWEYEAVKTGENTYQIALISNIEKGWYIYSQYVDKDAEFTPIPTSFTFAEELWYELKSDTGREICKVIEVADPLFDGLVLRKFKDRAVFVFDIKVTGKPGLVNGMLEFMSCDDEKCLAPQEVPFSLDLREAKQGKAFLKGSDICTPVKKNDKSKGTDKKDDGTGGFVPDDVPEMNGSGTDETDDGTDTVAAGETDKTDAEKKSAKKEKESSDVNLWGIFLAGLGGGLIALLTPCVFPMIPLTVSFFLKQGKTKKKGVINASVYGFSIVGIFLLIGLLFSAGLADDFVYKMSTGIFFNLLFFAIFVIFAISFFGAFEITLPSGLVNKMDRQSDRGGYIGIFFMALTLVLVSFSCTAPIAGSLILMMTQTGERLAPMIGMFGFSLALAIPFTLFAVFPNLLQTLPKSGGWMNSVKVVLGFVELALAFKFLSNVDLAYHWDFLYREVFLAIWIILAFLSGFYLLGKLRLSHDSELPYVSVPRLLFAIGFFVFGFYMVPGVFGAPVKMLSGLQPPLWYTVWPQGSPFAGGGAGESSDEQLKKLTEGNHCPQNLSCFHDYEAGMAYARSSGKPVLLDFTGYSCINCRKMEENVWVEPSVLKHLRDNYVLISLYVDEKIKLPEEDQFTTESGKKIRTIGQKWFNFQVTRFNANAQPWYVILGHDEEEVIPAVGYTPNAEKYTDWLESGLKEFKKNQREK